MIVHPKDADEIKEPRVVFRLVSKTHLPRRTSNRSALNIRTGYSVTCLNARHVVCQFIPMSGHQRIYSDFRICADVE